MRHTERFFNDCKAIGYNNQAVVTELKKDLEEYRDLLETLPTDEAFRVAQGKAQELRRILNLLEGTVRATGR